MTVAFDPQVFKTKAGTPYLKEPGVALVAAPQFFPMEATAFINSYGSVFDAADYENDWFDNSKHPGGAAHDNGPGDPLKLDPATSLVKFSGQLCYLSFGEKRSRNDDVRKYIDNILKSGHGSVLEHANFSVLVWGIDRAASHEAVRHRAGLAYSQMSQRYVDGKTLRFVERPEYQDDETLHISFENWIDGARKEYDWRAAQLQRVMAAQLESVPATERRKAVNSAARNCLPNETETAMVWTGNVRAWRHILSMRAAGPADRPIRALAVRIHQILSEVAEPLFADYKVALDDKGLPFLTTEWKKV